MAAGPQRRRTVKPAALFWFAVFTLMEGADIASSFAFTPRAEGNPLIRWAMIDLGDGWFIPKLVISLAAGSWCAWRWRLGHRIILIGASIVLAIVVVGNIGQQLGWGR